jgi:hypothetical protein
MKQLFFIFLFVLSSSFSWAQQERYSRVSILLNDEYNLKNLHKIGVCADHGIMHSNKTSFETELSQSELKALDNYGIPYKVIEYDVVANFLNQNTIFERQADNCSGSSGTGIPTPVNFELGSMGGYLTFQEMKDNLDSMYAKYPNLITKKEPLPPTAAGDSTSHEGRYLWYAKISDNASVDENEPEMIYTSIHHAREPASMSQMIFYMWYLLENYESDQRIQGILNNTELFFVPCLNPDGYVYNQTTNPNGGGMWRKNRRNNGDGTVGVDLNRNYPFHWGFDDVGSSPNSSSDVYRGPSAGSEPEIKLITNFVDQHNFKYALNYHTYGCLLIHPWGYLDTHTQDSTEFLAWSKHLTSLNNYTYGTGSQTVGYVVNGDSDDWFYGDDTSRAKIYSWTPEAGEAFWPPSSEIIRICEDNLEPNLWIASYLNNYARLSFDFPSSVSTNQFSVEFIMKRLGLVDNGQFEVGFVNVDATQITVPSNWVESSLTLLEEKDSTFQFTILSTADDVIEFDVYIDNGLFKEFYPIKINYTTNSGNSFVDSLNNANYWVGDWSLDPSSFTSPPYSIGDSPNGSNYSNNSTKTYTFDSIIDLTNAESAIVKFDVNFDIEKGFDYVSFKATEEGSSNVTYLCGKHTSLGTFNQIEGEHLYDGKSNGWLQETVILDELLDKKIKLSFELKSDQFVEGDGFNFDNFELSINYPVNTAEIDFSDIEIYPNPSEGIFAIQSTNKIHSIEVVNSTGKQIDIKFDDNQIINLSEFASGIYLAKIYTEKGLVTKKLIKK